MSRSLNKALRGRVLKQKFQLRDVFHVFSVISIQMTLSGINASLLFGEVSLFNRKASLPFIDVVQKFLSLFEIQIYSTTNKRTRVKQSIIFGWWIDNTMSMLKSFCTDFSFLLWPYCYSVMQEITRNRYQPSLHSNYIEKIAKFFYQLLVRAYFVTRKFVKNVLVYQYFCRSVMHFNQFLSHLTKWVKYVGRYREISKLF